MTASSVQLAPDSTGKRVATDVVTEDGQPVHRQRVVVDASALPTGAATEATTLAAAALLVAIEAKLPASPATAAGQGTGNASLTSIDGKLPALDAGALPVKLPAGQIATLTPPAAITGFATESTLGTVVVGLASIDGRVDGLEGLVGSTNTALGTVNTNLTTLAGHVDGVETLIGTTNSSLTTIAGHVDGLETAVASTNTKLDTLHTDVDGLEGLTGALTETAPGTDTASSGLNGRLQRVAQRLTSLITQLPATLGIKTAALSLSVAPASDAVFGTTGSALARTVLLNAVTATGAGSASADGGRPSTFTADLSGTGAISATVLIQGRNVASGQWVTLGTITLNGTAATGDGFGLAGNLRYMEYRANCTAISGTSATLSVAMGS